MKKLILNIIKDNNFLSLAGNMATAFFGLIIFALLARSFTNELFGEWVIYLTSATFIEMFRFGLTRTALIRFLAGSKGVERKKYIGSNYTIGLIATLIIIMILYVFWFLFPEGITEKGYSLFFIWYPMLSLANLPFNNALTIMQSEERFFEILIIRLINLVSFAALLAWNYFFKVGLSVESVVIWHLLINVGTSLICIVLKWDGILDLFHTTWKTTKTLLNFGKYTTLTLIGSNLLRSADTFILSISVLGTASVAQYSIPLKLTDLVQIPLRSFTATAFPRMSRASIENDIEKVKTLFYQYAGAITYLFIPITVLGYVFAEYFVLILGGKQFIGIDPVTGASTVAIFKVFALYGLLLPIDRLTGVALDSINRPKKNFYKIVVMVLANIIGDLIAVFVFKSLMWVALVTVIFTLIGVLLGYRYLKSEIDIKFSRIFIEGWKIFPQLIKNKGKFR